MVNYSEYSEEENETFGGGYDSTSVTTSSDEEDEEEVEDFGPFMEPELPVLRSFCEHCGERVVVATCPVCARKYCPSTGLEICNLCEWARRQYIKLEGA